MTCTDSRSVASVVGLPFVTRTAESPRPIPQTVRLPNISLSVANVDAVTVQSRVAGLVTIGPTVSVLVAARIWLWMTYGSCQSRCESNVHTARKPRSSACRASSTTRAAGGVACSTTPKSTVDSPVLPQQVGQPAPDEPAVPGAA